MDFETFLQRKYGRMGKFKDSDKDMAVFDNWLGQLDPQEWLDLAKEWGEELTKEVKEMVKEEYERGNQ